mmetsp:Transcript_24111/g.44754  ORF Transcript_24111/g.44754 Transcript_24111/m.44754 type:complete len:210 (+) Transcript_24111:346-975(+)
MESTRSATCGPSVPQRTASFSILRRSSSGSVDVRMSAIRSSSKTSFLRSASALKRTKTSLSWLSPTSKPSCSSLSRSAARPECLPMTRFVSLRPTSSGRMISKVSAFLSIPSWWMPDSWAKAFLPTMALLNCTGKPETAATRREMFMILVLSMPVWKGMMSLRTLRAITTSSRAVLPARSPSPLMVHSIWRAPASTAARLLAVAMPRSL